jgi:uncharacterized protein involved in tolerance to divalent cations
MTLFTDGLNYRYNGLKNHPRRGQGATEETIFKCVASGEAYAILYWDARVCGGKETTLVVKHGSNEWIGVSRTPV